VIRRALFGRLAGWMVLVLQGGLRVGVLGFVLVGDERRSVVLLL